MSPACHPFQYSLISFNVKREETANFNLVNRTKRYYSVTILKLEWFLFTTGMRRYVLNETKSFLFYIIRFFAFSH